MPHVPDIGLNQGNAIPQLGYGVFKIGQDEAEHAVGLAIEAGYRSIDTAAIYHNEQGVGRGIASALGRGIDRAELFVTTKLWNSEQGTDTALRAFETSLDKLGLDVVDLYLIHWPRPQDDRYVETWLTLEKIAREGRAKAIGVSNFTVEHLTRLMNETSIVPAVNQIELHPALQQDELHAFHREHGIVTEAWSPLAQGDLANPVIRSLAERHNRTPAQIVLRWHMQRGVVAIPKSVTPSRIRENIDVFDFALDDADMKQIAGLNSGGRLGPDPETY